MSLTDEERERLADVVRLQPTKNAELQDAWGMDSGSDVHSYLESRLGDYYFRDDDSLIRATEEAAELTGVEPGVEGGDGPGEEPPDAIRVPPLEAKVFAVVAGPEARSESVVSVLTKLRNRDDVDPDADEVRGALQSLRRKGVVEVVYRTVPTFRLAVDRDAVEVTVREDASVDADGDVASDIERLQAELDEIRG